MKCCFYCAPIDYSGFDDNIKVVIKDIAGTGE